MGCMKPAANTPVTVAYDRARTNPHGEQLHYWESGSALCGAKLTDPDVYTSTFGSVTAISCGRCEKLFTDHHQ